MTKPRQAQLPLLLSISEGLSRGTDEMLRVSPQGDAMHPPSCSLAIREAVEEIKWLRAEKKRLFKEVERIDDLFLSREKTLFTQRREIERLRAEIGSLGESEVLSRHSGSSGREWHNVGAWLYSGETINHVIWSPREEPEEKP